MRYPKFIFRNVSFFLLLVGLFLGSALSAPASLAQKKVIFKPPTSPAPQTTVGGATRGRCGDSTSETNLSITPVLPKNHYGLTLAARPTFLAYLPPSSSKQMFFSIKSEDGEQEFQTYLPTPMEKGIVAIQLPNGLPDLIIDKKYKWSLSIVCGIALRAGDPTSEGWIQRIAISKDVARQLQTLTPIAQIALYGERGIWYDMVSLVVTMRKSSGNQALNNILEQLLNEQGLEKLAGTS